MLLHPGTYFGGIWLVAVFSQWLLVKDGIAFTPYPEYIDELNIFVAFASACFSLFLILKQPTSKIAVINFNPVRSKNLFIVLLYVTFFGALLKLIYTWLSLGVFFNLGAVRVAYTTDTASIDRNFLFSLISYLNLLHPSLTIITGYFFGLKLQRINGLISSNWHLFIPFLISIIYVFTIGGRNPLADGIKLYLLGFAFAIPRNMPNYITKKIIFRIAFIVLLFIFFTTYVGEQRSQIAGQNSYAERFDTPVKRFFSGIFGYMSAHYWGYQLRSADTYKNDNLGYGYYTFYGILDAKIPFGNFVGLNGSLQNITNFDNNELDYHRLREVNKPGFFTTYSIFAQIKHDFGVVGSFIFIFIFSLITHYMFIKLIKKSAFSSMIALYFFYLIYEYWNSSNFQSIYSTNIVAPLLGFWLFDYLQKRMYKKNINRHISI